ncbi:hypothetical protein LHJ74_14740 [Streptomyces sp. N2-109]|uniref:Uncharacterized protein n=1 Tax=Streptomyces gossypii TaxID=2883101 RepID=A0ABT2JTD2_9ACTN|nr:hypothetical protein [Streptomyces gossypii]MCT2591149.1 hypothetical protein [Streptomyces gossypii]
MTDPVIIVTHTVMDGQVARWYRSVQDATTYRAVLSASRNGVKLQSGEYLTDVPDAWITAARDAHAELSAGRDADVRRLATHRHRGFTNGPIEAIEEGGA